MFEAKLNQASTFKKIVEALKDLVKQANFDCAPTGIMLQAMDQGHVALVGLLLHSEGFEHYRCDRNIPLGINLESMSKILKASGNEDSFTIKASDSGANDTVTFVFENPNGDRVSEFQLKLMDIQGDSLTIPDTEYAATVKIPSAQFQKICRDLTVMGDTITIEVSKGGIHFSANGDLGSGNVTLKPTGGIDSKSEESVTVAASESVKMAFAARYLNYFTKASSLASHVSISMSPEIPIVVEYSLGDLGYIRFYLAPKIEDEEE